MKFDNATLLNEVMPHVPGCAVAIAVNAIRNATIEFCKRSKLMVTEQFPISSIAAEPRYSLDEYGQRVVADVRAVWYDGLPLVAKTQAQLEVLYDNWTVETGTPLYYTQDNPSEIILVPSPDTALTDGITAHILFQPSRSAVTIEDWIVERHLEAIAHGALKRLFEIPKKPWSDAALVAYHHNKFESAIGDAEVAQARSTMAGRLRTAPPPI